MERTYDIFEVKEDGSLFWRDAVSGLEPALAKMRELAAKSTNGFKVMHLPSHSVIAVLDAKQAPPKSNGAERTGNDRKTKLSLRSRRARLTRFFSSPRNWRRILRRRSRR